MKLQNNNTYSIMYGMEFIKPGEVVDVEDDKTAKMLLNQPNVVEFVSKEQVTSLEQENEKLKKELELANLKAQADALGIKYSPNIGAAKLKAKIDAEK